MQLHMPFLLQSMYRLVWRACYFTCCVWQSTSIHVELQRIVSATDLSPSIREEKVRALIFLPMRRDRKRVEIKVLMTDLVFQCSE
jgi:hypothetical protein